jgi:hypothetical protein
MLPRVVVVGVSACSLALTFALGQTANAQTTTYCWIDAKTGNRVPTITIPATTSVLDYRNYREGTDQNHISLTERGRTFVRQPDGSWIDGATGEQVSTITIPATTSVLDYRNYREGTDQNHISLTERGRTFVLIPCPPSPQNADTNGPPVTTSEGDHPPGMKTTAHKTAKKVVRKTQSRQPETIPLRGGPGNGGD